MTPVLNKVLFLKIAIGLASSPKTALVIFAFKLVLLRTIYLYSGT